MFVEKKLKTFNKKPNFLQSYSWQFLVYSVIIIFISFFTYFFNYQNPSAPFWDENYHIASAEKYIQGTYFTEPHPPLGKLFIALGEVIFKPNENIKKPEEYLTKDYLTGKELGPISYLGYRFFPALFGFLSGFIFFLILYLISRNFHTAFIASSFFLFENGMIVHFRGAMLESTQVFFLLLSVLWFIIMWTKNYFDSTRIGVLGVFIGLSIAVKVNSTILLLLPIFLGLKYISDIETLSKFKKNSDKFLVNQNQEKDLIKKNQTFWHDTLKNFHKKIANSFLEKIFIVQGQGFPKKIKFYFNLQRKNILVLFSSVLSFSFVVIFVFLSIQYIHQVLGRDFLVNNNYRFSEERRAKNQFLVRIDEGIEEMIVNNQASNPLNVWKTTAKWYYYLQFYTEGVPKLDLTKEDENGSYPSNWIVGNRTISYRWEKYAIQKSEYRIYPFLNFNLIKDFFVPDFIEKKFSQNPDNFQPYRQRRKDFTITLNEHSKLTESQKKDYVVVVRYLYLIGNPAIFFGILFGLVLILSFIIAWIFFGLEVKKNKYFQLTLCFSTIYVAYMITVLNVDRVLYLYHYFIPLLFGMLAVYSFLHYQFENYFRENFSQRTLVIFGSLFFLTIFACYIFFSPLTYYLPVSRLDFERREWFDFWLMRNVG